MLRRRALLAGGFSGLAASRIARAQPMRDLTIATTGGSFQEAQRAALFRPWAQARALRILEVTWDGGIAPLRARRAAGDTDWDLILVEGDVLELGCAEDLFEPMDVAQLGGEDVYVAGAAHRCGIGTAMAALVLAWDREKLAQAPTGWADLFDLARFPGRRALRRTARGTLEMALLAAGVAPPRLYDALATGAGADRAFAKLAGIRDATAWWDRPAQPGLWLAGGEVVMAAAPNGRITALNVAEGRDIGILWAQSLSVMLSWAIARGSPNRAVAMDFLAYAGGPAPQAALAAAIGYAPVSRAAPLPPGPGPATVRAASLPIEEGFWAGPAGVALEARFAAFVAG